MTLIQARDRQHLDQLIKTHLRRHGSRCNLNHIDVSHITDMSFLFYRNAFDGDLSKWDVSNVTRMAGMFMESSFNGDLSLWDVSRVTDMANMFSGSPFNGDLSLWDVSRVTDMANMFSGSPFNRDISRWNTSNVQTMKNMFFQTAFKGDLSNWNVSNVVDFNGTFRESMFNGDISRWNVSKALYMSFMFDKSQFRQLLSSWEISVNTDIQEMVSQDYAFECLPSSIQSRYSELFNTIQLSRICKVQPLGMPHIVSAFQYKRCPKHVDSKFFTFVKTQQRLCEALDMAKEDMALHIHQQYRASLQSHQTLVLPEAVDFTGGSS